ncbi:helix-turn-helix domain-containing protein [Microbacterium marinum]|uniref:helix-turn-helix domain-containing protein n=1 Tax=Microbacterium marinum TaxID=421115 RepID=UPI00384E85F9
MNWSSEDATRFGEALRDARLAAGLTQERLAAKAGLTKNLMQLLEAGRSSGQIATARPSNPRIETLAAIASALDMTVSDLLKRAGL